MPVNMNLAALYMNENGEYKPIPGVRGEPGVTPTISVEDIPGGHRVTIAGADGSTSIDVMDGTNGVSPTVAVTDITGGHRVTITDATGSRSFDVLDGANGSDGAPGTAGFSPTVAVTDITGGHRVTITDATGSRSFDVLDGANGSDGSPGAAGVSPTVAVTDITGGHRVTITDATGTNSFNVMDGTNGQGVPPGGTAGQVLKKKTNTDYDAEWGDGSGSGMIVTFTQSGSTYTADKTYAEVYAAVQNMGVVYGKKAPPYQDIYTVARCDSSSVQFRRGFVSGSLVTWEGFDLKSNNTVSVEKEQLSVPAAVSVKINIYVDGESEYQDPPTGTLSAEDIPSYTMQNLIWDEGMAVYALYGEDLSDTGTSERYSLASINVESRYYEDWGTDAQYIKANFRTIGERNGTPLLKKIVIEGFPDVSLYQATVTYSETALAVQS